MGEMKAGEMRAGEMKAGATKTEEDAGVTRC
jgi:hypothetical protein